MYIYKKTKSVFAHINPCTFRFNKSAYKRDSLNRSKHDFSNVLLSAKLNQRSDDKNSCWRIYVYPDSVPIETTSFNMALTELVKMISDYNDDNFYGIVEYVIQRINSEYKIFDVSFR